MSLVKRALIFARRAHEAVGQQRKYTQQPYIVHPIAVSEIVKSVKHDPYMVAAALLHDVVEDTETTSEQVHEAFGPQVGDLVDWLTDISTPADGNREARKAKDRLHLAMAPARVKTIKLADLLDNGVSIKKHDPDFWRVYRAEALRLLEALKHGDESLWLRVEAMCNE